MKRGLLACLVVCRGRDRWTDSASRRRAEVRDAGKGGRAPRRVAIAECGRTTRRARRPAGRGGSVSVARCGALPRRASCAASVACSLGLLPGRQGAMHTSGRHRPTC
jgi:hypothetical protein